MILITGGSGFIGAEVVSSLLRTGREVRCLVRDPEVLTKRPNLAVCRGDITDMAAVEEAVEGCESIVHLAAVMKGGDADIFRANVTGTRNIARAAQKYGVKKFVFASTENVLPEKKDAYATSKMQAEDIVRELKEHVILRFSAAYGRGCRGNMRSLFNAIQGRKLIPVIGNGDNYIQPIFVADAARYAVNALDCGEGTFIAAGKQAVTMNDFIDRIASAFHKNVIKIHAPLSFVKAGAAVLACFGDRSITSAMVDYATLNRSHDISTTIKLLRHEPVNLEDGLRLTTAC